MPSKPQMVRARRLCCWSRLRWSSHRLRCSSPAQETNTPFPLIDAGERGRAYIKQTSRMALIMYSSACSVLRLRCLQTRMRAGSCATCAQRTMPSGAERQRLSRRCSTATVGSHTWMPCQSCAADACCPPAFSPPCASLCSEMADPSRLSKRGLTPALKYCTLLGFAGGFLLAYQRSSCECLRCASRSRGTGACRLMGCLHVQSASGDGPRT